MITKSLPFLKNVSRVLLLGLAQTNVELKGGVNLVKFSNVVNHL